MSSARVHVKKLSQGEAASVYAIRHMTAESDVETHEHLIAMIGFGARSKTIRKLTGAHLSVIRRLCKRDPNYEQPKGRLERSLNRILDNPVLHLEGSLFVSFVQAYHLLYPHLDSKLMVETVRLTRHALRGSGALSFESQLSLAESFVAKEIHLVRCPECSTRFVKSARMTKIGSTYRTGDCPYCYAMDRIRRGRSVKATS